MQHGLRLIPRTKFNLIFLDVKAPTDAQPCVLEILSLNDSHVTNEFFSVLVDRLKGRQLPLVDLDLGANESLTADCLDVIVKLTSGKTMSIYNPLLPMDIGAKESNL